MHVRSLTFSLARLFSQTLDDMWCLDLNKLDCWQCMKENSSGEEAFRELSDEEEDE